MDTSASAIKILIIICVILFVIPLMVPGISREIFEALALYFPKNEKFGYWQFITNIFMHAGFAHIFFNMYALWAFGSPLEQMWGRNKFLFFFFSSGIGAAIVYTLVNFFRFNNLHSQLLSAGISAEEINAVLSTDRENLSSLGSFSDEKLLDFYNIFHIPVVGASGAIYGVLVAFGILFPNAKLFLIFLPIPIAAKYFIPALIALDLFSGVTGVSIFGAGIAHFGHVGGAIIGFLLMWYWSHQKRGTNRARNLS
jgi:membrane associated rhomboid family serine protease